MKEITQKLISKANEKIREFVNDAQKAGMDKGRAIDAIKAHIDMSVKNYYAKRDFTKISECYDMNKFKAESKIEGIFYNTLKDNKIPFEFQVEIGKYRADYLINKFLVVEIDGPQHEKIRDDIRDAYMRRMGYKIIRVPTWLLCMDSVAVVESIKEVINT